MKKRFAKTALTLFLTLLMCSCSYVKQFQDSNSDYGSIKARNQGKDSTRSYGLSEADSPAGHHNERIFLSEEAMYAIDKIQGVAAAVVVISDKNAYVGVITDNSSTGTYSEGNISDVNNAGTSDGEYNTHTGSPYAPPRQLATKTNNYFTVPGKEKLASKLLNNIAVQVRDMHPHILQVYISSNFDYVNALNELALDYWQGNPLDNRLQAFNDMVQQLFNDQ